MSNTKTLKNDKKITLNYVFTCCFGKRVCTTK